MNPDWDDVMKNRARQPKPPANPPTPGGRDADFPDATDALRARVEQLEVECRGLHAQLQEARDALRSMMDDMFTDWRTNVTLTENERRARRVLE